MSIGAIILAAGASQRLGHPKQNIVLDGETLVARASRIAREAALSPVILVMRADVGPPISGPLENVEIVINPHPEEGIASSIRCGIAAASSAGAGGVVIMTCDQPAVSASHLRALIADKELVTGSRYAGTVGTPAYFPVSHFAELLRLGGDTGARALLRNSHSIEMQSLELDIDTSQDLERALAIFEPHS